MQRWNLPTGWVISARPAHPAIVSEAEYIAAQQATAPRGPAGPATRRYLLAGPRQPHHEAPTSGQRDDSLPLLRQLPPDDLATELNPHKTELNPHQAVSGGQPHKGQIKTVPSVPGGPLGGRPWLPQEFRRMMGPPPAVPDIETGPAAYGLPKAGPAGAGVDSRGLG